MPRRAQLALLRGLLIVLGCALLLWGIAALPWTAEPPGQQTRWLLRRDDFILPVLHRQFSLPTGVIAVLLLIGGDIVQQVIAQLTGSVWFTPVVFSFGWVTYAFSAVASAVGDGSYLPQPESSGVVVTISTGDCRQINSWVLSRLMRDMELEIESTTEQPTELDTGLLVSVWQAQPGGKLWPWGPSWGQLRPKLDFWWWSFLFFLATQLAIAIWRGVLLGNWSIMLVVGYGNVLAWLTAVLPAVNNEKFACRPNSRLSYALTRGNGHKHVFLILPSYGVGKSNLPRLEEIATATGRAGLTSRFLSVFFAALWSLFLLFVAGVEDETGWLLLVGIVGMVHNIVIAGVPRTTAAHGIPLRRCTGVDNNPIEFGRNTEGRQRVADVLIQLERDYPAAGLAIRPLFFPGFLTDRDLRKWKFQEAQQQGNPQPKRVDFTTLKSRLDDATRTRLLEENPLIPNAAQAVTDLQTGLGRLMDSCKAPNYETQIFDDHLWHALALQGGDPTMEARKEHFKKSKLSALHSTFGLI